MNNNYYPNYQTQGGYPNQEFAPTVNNNIYQEQSYIENILRLNKGKIGKFYCTFPDSTKLCNYSATIRKIASSRLSFCSYLASRHIDSYKHSLPSKLGQTIGMNLHGSE